MNYSRKNTISQQKNDGQSYSLGITQSSGLEYHAFYNAVKNAAPLARKAYESTDVEESVLLWRTFFCDSEEFPRYTGDQSKNGFTPRIQKSETIPTGRFG